MATEPNTGKCLIVIPTHKPLPTSEEQKSFINTIQTLSKWPIRVVLPSGISGLEYQRLARDVGIEIDTLNLRPGFMGSIENYNKMALSPDFYKLFIKFENILIVHLDSWIFRDELNYWLEQGYEYVGAPLFLPRGDKTKDVFSLMSPQGGNGGLSLRNVSKHIELTERLKIKLNTTLVIKGVMFLSRNKQFHFVKIFVKSIFSALRSASKFRSKNSVYEDAMISIYFSLLDRTFRVAPPEKAIGFALEVNAEEILEYHSRLSTPFGLHGYDKYIEAEYFKKLINNRARQERSYAEIFFHA